MVPHDCVYDCIKNKLFYTFGQKHTFYFNFQADGWDTEPFVLTEIDGKLFGRGSTDDKVKCTEL